MYSVDVYGYNSHEKFFKNFPKQNKNCLDCQSEYNKAIDICYKGVWSTEAREDCRKDRILIKPRRSWFTEQFGGEGLSIKFASGCHILIVNNDEKKRVLVTDFRCSNHPLTILEMIPRGGVEKFQITGERAREEIVKMQENFKKQLEQNTISAWELFERVHPGEWVKTSLENRNHTLDEFAKDTGILKERLEQIIKGLEDPSDEEVKTLQKAIGYQSNFLVDMNELYKLKKSGAPAPTPG